MYVFLKTIEFFSDEIVFPCLSHNSYIGKYNRCSRKNKISRDIYYCRLIGTLVGRIKIGDVIFNSKYNGLSIATYRDVMSQSYLLAEGYEICKVVASYPKYKSTIELPKDIINGWCEGLVKKFNSDIIGIGIWAKPLDEPYERCASSLKTPDLLELETKLDNALKQETKETLSNFLITQRLDAYAEKPTTGLVPRYIENYRRFKEVLKAIKDHVDSLENVPIEWIEEYNELLLKISIK